MNAPTIDRAKRTIVVSKEYYRKSCIFGEEEYTELIGIQRDFPRFRIVVKKEKNNNVFKNITLDFMVEYIDAHDDAAKTIMDKFLILRGKKKENGKYSAVSFFELKTWFLNTFPEIKDVVDEAREVSSTLLLEAAENAKKHKEERIKRKEEQNNECK